MTLLDILLLVAALPAPAAPALPPRYRASFSSRLPAMTTSAEPSALYRSLTSWPSTSSRLTLVPLGMRKVVMIGWAVEVVALSSALSSSSDSSSELDSTATWTASRFFLPRVSDGPRLVLLLPGLLLLVASVVLFPE
ncbi:hypothetical protein BDY21DRAFT_353928 [Lineolata rhizophorae]|uniref:Secreted protein n=1 Tax=Lineolata rhizophorae TaxID=578093 RepID=A0A6A6NQR1_9PEZI|nr:hypothetical protein BDY21DRAFT_353928 [Lineolata rhizophorae]